MPAHKTWICNRTSVDSTDNTHPFLILAYYHLVALEDPQQQVMDHKKFFENRDVKGRIYLAKQGINGTLSAPKEVALDYIRWLTSLPQFQDAEFKVQEYPDHAFGKLCVKTRAELVALGVDVPLEMRGEHLSPDAWRKLFEEEEDKVVLDVRNEYEWEVGHFEGAEKPACDTFKDFTAYAEALKARIRPDKTKVLMYCTGGIRCEFFSAMLKKQGIEKVYQLQGGIINYGAKEKSKHWKGSLFVFDDRLSVPISEEETESVGKCHHCQGPTDRYYNCAYMDCNELFLCCEACLKNSYGCCTVECSKQKRVRPYKLASTPFRKWYTYAKTKEELNSLQVHSLVNSLEVN